MPSNNPNPAFIQSPVVNLGFGLGSTATYEQPLANTTIAAGLVTPSAFGYYRLLGLPNGGHPNLPDPNNVPVGK
jgi:hypothetical protein